LNIENLVQPAISLFGSVCAFCETPIPKGEKVLSSEKKFGVGILSKTIRYEVHIPCAVDARDILTKKILEALAKKTSPAGGA
jgi:hypothetical protein